MGRSVTTAEASLLLYELGFKDAWTGTDWRTHPLSDRPIAGLVYLMRSWNTGIVKTMVYKIDGKEVKVPFPTMQHQYVSLCGAADGTFTEAAIFVYPRPADSRIRERPLFLGIRRTIEEVVAVVETAYPPLKP